MASVPLSTLLFEYKGYIYKMKLAKGIIKKMQAGDCSRLHAYI